MPAARPALRSTPRTKQSRRPVYNRAEMDRPPYKDVTVGDLLARLARALPSQEAVVYVGGPRFTFAALDAEARTIARGLMALGRRSRHRRGARRAWPRRWPRRRHQHAVHVGNDGLSEGRDAVQPQHREQRLSARRVARLYAGRSSLPLRPVVPLLRLRDRRA